ncbi:MAG: BrnA antitoxin family protein [Sulfuritalea sp.]|nr:BrnA antitoxin family protein [Sulfuritalea sp.]
MGAEAALAYVTSRPTSAFPPTMTSVNARRKQRGRPPGSDKEPATIRFVQGVLAAFRAPGPGRQKRMNAALRDWLKNYSPASVATNPIRRRFELGGAARP